MSPIAIPELLDQIDAGGSVVLPTSRAATELRAAYDSRQRARGHVGWEPAPVVSWAQWTNALWNDLILAGAEQRLLLNPAQELALWREIVAEPVAGDAAAAVLGSPDALAQLARDAWQLAARYNATGRLRASANTHDTRIFAAWADAFTRRCATRGYLSAALLEQALQQHVENGALTAPAALTLAAFLEESPAQQELLTVFVQHGSSIQRQDLVHTPDGEAPLRAWTTAATEREELTLAARWVRGFLEARGALNQPARVSILLPQFSDDRAALEAALRDVLAPELNDLAADLSATPWEFSSGPALASLPIVAAALGLAQWASHPLPVDAITAILLSPYLGHNAAAAEREASARFDASVLRRSPMLRDELSLAQVLALGGRTTAHVPAMLGCLRDVHTVLQRAGDLQRPRTFADWGEFVRDLTRAANWPGDRPSNATDLEATRAWDGLLDSLATLDFQGRRVPYAAFLEELDRQAGATAFKQPATHAPVQVMALAEAEGCTFDAVVLLRATDANWPQQERTHPLLAWPLQRSLGMPGTNPAQSAARARAAGLDLLDRSCSLLCTLAAEDADGPLRPSPLMSALGLQYLDSNELERAAQPVQPIALVTAFDDTPLPPLASNEVPGGANVLKLQAACGFLAFAELRLRASEPETPTLGLDTGESGSFLHKALQGFWRETRTQQALRELSLAERSARLAACIDAALPPRLRAETAWDDAYLALQKQRLLSVLDDWLDVELQRAPFEVFALESEQEVPIGPLTLDVRLDRLDRVGAVERGDAGFFLVDYKSGLAGHPSEWETDRPIDPQLPLYALLHEPAELKGLAFAKVRAGKEMRWIGVQSEDGLLPAARANKAVDMPWLLDTWRTTLTQLAEDFAAGRAGVRPRDFHKDCARCAQRLLCRVDPRVLNAVAEDDPAAEEDDG
jgi:ATP-dependent helicase/nuclease subunit B